MPDRPGGPSSVLPVLQPIGQYRQDDRLTRNHKNWNDPRFASEMAFLRGFGIGIPTLNQALEQALRNGSSVEEELLASGVLNARTYYGALAERLRIPFLSHVGAQSVVPLPSVDASLLHATPIAIREAGGDLVYVITPSARAMAGLEDYFRREPRMRERTRVAMAGTMRRAVWQAGARRRVETVIRKLFETAPQDSARVTFTARQGFVCALILCICALATWTWPGATLTLGHIGLSTIFTLCIALRIAALVTWRPPARPHHDPGDRPMPVYTVLVALYREAAVVGQLVEALGRIDWPRSRLQIMLACEADDTETLQALQALALPAHMEVVLVPEAAPRTKPKALSYALEGARGEFLVIYDAEDRPHPGQLRQAWATFRQGAPDLACLQAPLVIDNGRKSFLSGLFALEYAALFRGLLPFLARSRLPIPLGGTSNHFRVDLLRSSGAWDPYNVTEDADLGMRLYRRGYHCDVLSLPTWEDAPVLLSDWMGQRTRWFKGWLQTWFVAMRHPALLMKDLGFSGMLIFQILVAGMLISALLHPLIAFLVWRTLDALSSGAIPVSPVQIALLVVDMFNVVAGFVAFVMLGLRAMTGPEQRAVGWRWLGVPVYWALLFWAAWRALRDLFYRPHFWHKTPHESITEPDLLAASANTKDETKDRTVPTGRQQPWTASVPENPAGTAPSQPPHLRFAWRAPLDRICHGIATEVPGQPPPARFHDPGNGSSRKPFKAGVTIVAER